MIASNQFRRDVANLLTSASNVHDLAGALMEVASRLRELRVTVTHSGYVGADEMLKRMVLAESEVERTARSLSFNA
jgi:hypothetical protein